MREKCQISSLTQTIPSLFKKKKKKDTENVPREINKVVDDGFWCFHVRE